MAQFNKGDVQLGPATPTQAEAAAPLIYDTDPKLFDYMYSDGYEAALKAIEFYDGTSVDNTLKQLENHSEP